MSPLLVRLHRRDLRLALGVRAGHDRHADRAWPSSWLPTRVTQVLIMLGGALRGGRRCSASIPTIRSRSASTSSWACRSGGRGGRGLAGPGARRDSRRGRRPAGPRAAPQAAARGPISAEWAVYLGTAAGDPGCSCSWSPASRRFTADSRPMTLDPRRRSIETLASQRKRAGADRWPWCVKESSRPAGLVLVLAGLVAFGYLGHRDLPPRHDPPPADVRRADPDLLLDALLGVLRAGRQLAQQLHRPQRGPRVRGSAAIAADEVGKTIQHPAHAGAARLPQRRPALHARRARRAAQRAQGANPDFEIDWKVAEDNVGMGIAERGPTRSRPARSSRSTRSTSWSSAWCSRRLWALAGQPRAGSRARR